MKSGPNQKVVRAHGTLGEQRPVTRPVDSTDASSKQNKHGNVSISKCTHNVAQVCPAALAIAQPSGIMRALQLVPVIWNRPVHAAGDQGQSAQNISDRDDVDDRPGFCLIKELGSRVCDLPPPVRLSPAARYETSSEHNHLHKYFFGAHGIFI
jgi:hypothetical protein